MLEAMIVYIDPKGSEQRETRHFRVLPRPNEYIARSGDEFYRVVGVVHQHDSKATIEIYVGYIGPDYGLYERLNVEGVAA